MDHVKPKDKRHLIVGAILLAIIIWLLLRKRLTVLNQGAPFSVNIPGFSLGGVTNGHRPFSVSFGGGNKYKDTQQCGCGPCGRGSKARLAFKDFVDPILVFPSGPQIGGVFADLYTPPVRGNNVAGWM